MARCLNVDPAEFDGGPNLYWYISDALSTVRLVVNGSGAVVDSYASDEFGNQTAATGNADLRQHTYTGGLGVRDDGAALGLLYARQRYYDPSVGRWLSADPIGFTGGLNLYTYVGNRPTNAVDPSGLDAYIWIRQQNNSNDTGHSWIEVDNGRGGHFSIGSYPQANLSVPDSWHSTIENASYKQRASVTSGGNTFRVAKVIRLTPEEDQKFIRFLEREQQKSKACPGSYYELKRKGRTLDPSSKVCTTCVVDWLHKTFDTKVPRLIQPNNLYNYYNPDSPLPAGPMTTPLGDPLPP